MKTVKKSNFIHKVLLEHSHTHSSTYCLGLLSHYNRSSYGKDYMVHKSYNIYSMTLCRKSLLIPHLNMLFCNYVVLFLPEIGINNSLGHLKSWGLAGRQPSHPQSSQGHKTENRQLHSHHLCKK